jgi:hypothetical protein
MRDPAPTGDTLKPMAKQSKKPADLNRLAAAIVGDATDETPQTEDATAAAIRKGGAKGGRARAARLTAKERTAAAKRAAAARWSPS